MSPFPPRFFDRNGLRMHHVDEGQGDPLVFVHGNPTWSYYFRGLIQGLRGDFRCIALDHIGCGLSDKPDDSRYRYTLQSRVDDLDALIGHLNLGDRITLLVHDWGGMIGLAWAVRHAERVKRLVILNTSAFLLPPGKKLPWQLWLVRNTPLGAILVRGLNLFSRGLVSTCAAKPLPAEVKRAYLAPYDSWKNRIAVLRFVQDIPLKPGDESYPLCQATEHGLARLRGIPMLICWGEKDFVFDLDFLRGWQERFPEATVHRFPGAGHLVLEDAGSEVLAEVRRFLGVV